FILAHGSGDPADVARCGGGGTVGVLVGDLAGFVEPTILHQVGGGLEVPLLLLLVAGLLLVDGSAVIPLDVVVDLVGLVLRRLIGLGLADADTILEDALPRLAFAGVEDGVLI